MIENLSQLVTAELRKRGNKSVKSLFWNSDQGNLSVFAKNHTPDFPKSFNYAPDVDMSIEDIADYVALSCDDLMEDEE